MLVSGTVVSVREAIIWFQNLSDSFSFSQTLPPDIKSCIGDLNRLKANTLRASAPEVLSFCFCGDVSRCWRSHTTSGALGIGSCGNDTGRQCSEWLATQLQSYSEKVLFLFENHCLGGKNMFQQWVLGRKDNFLGLFKLKYFRHTKYFSNITELKLLILGSHLCFCAYKLRFWITARLPERDSFLCQP